MHIFRDILNFQNIDKNKVDLKIELPENKLKVFLKTKNDLNSVTTDITLKTSSEKEEINTQLSLNNTNKEVQRSTLDLKSKLEKQSDSNDNQSQSIEYMVLLKPPPRLRDHLLLFLSEDLIKKTLEVYIYLYSNIKYEKQLFILTPIYINYFFRT